ncbi:hypothetical protein D1B31_12960 [Neobacillus notoginsengisoli]|uniref:Uncharacterized protein n=1 Tax=Neobacillus notoginsengisoli TaxID=1578198 RepID=A0A417YSA8_9BACI|nr:hypothetical protein [Neobacillus notoginsengisoli]RHW38888.1 hypothetical protein D1B31_12960 [Neobacillus notoginsengisoli]
MSMHSLFVLFSLSGAVIVSSVISWKLKHQLGHSEGMAITMLLGMLIGLAGGTAFGSIFQGNLYASTLYSILFGAVAGTAVAPSLGLMAILEGFAGGLMGGMMGAMLGEMISPVESIKLVNILLALTFCSLLLFAVLSSRSDKEAFIPSKGWFMKPFITFLLISGVLIGGTQAAKYMDHKKAYEQVEKRQEEHNH